MTAGHVALAVLVALAAVGFIAIADRAGRAAGRALARRRASPRTDEGTDAGQLVAQLTTAFGAPAAAAPWLAMPCGTRIEYGSTGWWIELRPQRGASAQPYAVWTPEGDRAAWGGDLQGLKRMVERLAADRAEFVPRPVAVPRWIDPRRDL